MINSNHWPISIVLFPTEQRFRSKILKFSRLRVLNATVKGAIIRNFVIAVVLKVKHCCDHDVHTSKLELYCWQMARRVQRSVKVTKHGTIPYVRYSFLLVCYSNMSLTRAVFQIFDFKKRRDLEIWVRDHLRSLKVVPFDTMYGFLLLSYNFVRKMHRFWDIRLQKMPWPWKPG